MKKRIRLWGMWGIVDGKGIRRAKIAQWLTEPRWALRTAIQNRRDYHAARRRMKKYAPRA